MFGSHPVPIRNDLLPARCFPNIHENRKLMTGHNLILLIKSEVFFHVFNTQ